METKNTKETKKEIKEAQNDTKALSKQEAKELWSTGFFFVVPLWQKWLIYILKPMFCACFKEK